MHHQVHLTPVVGCGKLLGRWNGVIRRVVDDQVKFRRVGIDENRLEAGQTIGQQERCDRVGVLDTSQDCLLLIRYPKGLEVVETVREKNVFVLFGGVDDQVELGLGAKAQVSFGSIGKQR